MNLQVKYTVHTKTTMLEFAKCEMSVVREHEEFIWLHSCLEDNEAYAGFIVRFPSFMRIQVCNTMISDNYLNYIIIPNFTFCLGFTEDHQNPLEISFSHFSFYVYFFDFLWLFGKYILVNIMVNIFLEIVFRPWIS